MTGPDAMTDRLRPMTEADLPAVAELVNVVRADAGWADQVTAALLAEQTVRAGMDLATDARVAVAADDRPIGWAVVPPPRDTPPVSNVVGGVRPDRRGRGLGRALLAWQCARATELAAELPAGGEPVLVRSEAVEGAPAAAALLRRGGFAPVRYWAVMHRPVDGPLPATDLPDGLEVCPYRPEHHDALYRTHAVAFAQHWGYRVPDAAEWRDRLAGADFRPAQSVLAVDRHGEVAGYVLSVGFTDPTRLTMNWIGTAPAWRRRGVAAALIGAALRTYRAAGIHSASLDVDSANATGAVAVYERAGFTVDHRGTVFELALSAAGPATGRG